MRTALKSKAFLYRALEGVEEHIWGSNCRFFFCSCFSSPCKLILQVSQVCGWREKEESQICAVASFWVYVTKCDSDPAVLKKEMLGNTSLLDQ